MQRFLCWTLVSVPFFVSVDFTAPTKIAPLAEDTQPRNAWVPPYFSISFEFGVVRSFYSF